MTSADDQANTLPTCSRLQSITSSFADESIVISCYLDGRKKVSEWTEFLDQQIAQLAETGHLLPASSCQLLYSLIGHNQPLEFTASERSLAIFVSADDGPLVHQVIPVNKAIENSFLIYRKPNLLPLIHAGSPLDSAVLLALVNGVVRVYDIDNGRFRSAGWASAPHIHSGIKQETHSVVKQSKMVERLTRVCQALLKRRFKPIILAANSAGLSALKSWLPGHLSWTVRNEVEIPYARSWPDIIHKIKRMIVEAHQFESRRLTDLLINSARMHGQVALGPIACVRALAQNRLQKLVIERHSTLTGTFCRACEESVIGKTEHCQNCGSQHIEHWNPFIESAWLALTRGIPVFSVESEPLRYLGGIGGLLRHPMEGARSPIPKIGINKNLRLVA